MYQLPDALAPLASYAQFVLVLLEQKHDKDGVAIPNKYEKYPCDYRTGRMTPKDSGGALNPKFWTDVETAIAAADSFGEGYCIGFTITADDPFSCFDLDDCLAPLGGWLPEVQEMLEAWPGAIELSLSGSGLHVWSMYQGEPPEHSMKCDYKRGKKWLEFYTEKRFMALGYECSGEMTDNTELLPEFIDAFFPPRVAAAGADEGWRDGPCDGHTLLTDEKLLAKALNHKRQQTARGAFSGDKPVVTFTDLWTRDVERLAACFPPLSDGKEFDGSDADFALAKDLAYWTGRDHARIEMLMRQSALVRDKWDEKRKHGTYLQETILEAVARCTQVFNVPPLKLPPPPPPRKGQSVKLVPSVIKHSTMLFGEEIATLFDGCIYIQDDNAILLPNGDIVDQARFKAKFGGRSFQMDAGNAIKPSKDPWEAFLFNQVIAFPRVDGTTFDPSLDFQQVVERSDRQWLNVYKAPAVVREEGDVSRFMELLYKILPNGDDAVILLSYFAAVVQYPGVKFRWAPFIQGTQGNGKSTLIECLKYALGRKYIFSVESWMITNNFNAWLEKNILYVADDIYTSTDRDDIMEKLKTMITSEDRAITPKGIDSIEKRIVGNFIFTDNHKDAARKRDGTRRLCTFYCAQQTDWDRRRDGLTKTFFAGPNGFVPWLKAGGYAAVAHMLATMPIDPRYNPAEDCQEAPETSVTREAIIDGRTQMEHDVAEWIELDEPGFSGGFVSFDALKRKMSANPAYSKSMGQLKVKEMMLRLEYVTHPGLPEGRTARVVKPDGKRAVLFAHREAWHVELEDAEAVAMLYEQAQKEALVRNFIEGGT